MTTNELMTLWALVIACCGFGLSLILGIIRLIEFILRGMRRLNIYINPNLQERKRETNKLYGPLNAEISVTNLGEKPVTMRDIWLLDREGRKNYIDRYFVTGPKSLINEGGSQLYRINQKSENLKNCTHVCVLDSLGKIHKKKIWSWMKKEMEKREAKIEKE